jgi:superfamily II DNA or RNA helicase
LPRLHLQSERVQNLIREVVAPLFFVCGNTAALTKLLNDSANQLGLAGTIHPNRLHTLLSDDPARGLNETTIQLIETAARGAMGSAPHHAALAAEKEAELLKQIQSEMAGGVTARQVTEQFSLPPAIASRLLSSWVPATAAASKPHSPSGAAGSSHGHPDWSYQDVAVARCLDAFRRLPHGKIGLILPTGGGKTRTALRIVLQMLRLAATSKGLVYWITHRRNLREQAFRELQQLQEASDDPQLVELANRIKFVMVGDLAKTLEGAQEMPVLLVIDEAHHAAAASYQPALTNSWQVPVLLLTATPNRTDQLPIGIDEIAFTITHRELAERRAVLIPKFEDFPVADFDWSESAIDELAEFVIDRAYADFTKVLVLAPRVDRVEEFYDALVAHLPADHPLTLDDIGFVHGAGNSLGISNDDFLTQFRAKPRAFLISAHLLLEGFDDPAINAVVITYPSTSLIRLIQAAGRAVRHAPGKKIAYVIQARNDSLAYHLDERWLYQELDDLLRPKLVDIEYGSAVELRDAVKQQLQAHNLDAQVCARLESDLAKLEAGDRCNLFLYGLPFFGLPEDFAAKARWGGILETAQNAEMIRLLFNRFCAQGADLSDPSDFLQHHGPGVNLVKDTTPGSRWSEMVGLLTASYFAKKEVFGPAADVISSARPFRNQATTWLKYMRFIYRPAVPGELAAFLVDCHNRDRIEATYLERPASWKSVVKVPLPLQGFEAYLLDEPAVADLERLVADLHSRLIDSPPADHVGIVAAFGASAWLSQLSPRLLLRLEFLLTPQARAERVLSLTSQTTPT